MNRTADEWKEELIEMGVREVTADVWSTIFADVIKDDTFSSGAAELPVFMGQVLHESAMLEKLEEGLYYKTAGRLIATWPTRFKTPEDELPYLRNPEALANKVYGGRMGNINAGDGWKFRGSGLIQVTGADNFHALQNATGVAVFDNPYLLRQPTSEALKVCIAWWEGHVPDSIMGDIKKVTKDVNGGLVGLADRQRLTDESESVLS